MKLLFWLKEKAPEPSIQESIDRAIALAAALPPERPRRAPLNTKLCRRCGVYSMTSATRCQDCGSPFECNHVGMLPPVGWAAWTTSCLKCGVPFELTRQPANRTL